jgi:hypothetical protein
MAKNDVTPFTDIQVEVLNDVVRSDPKFRNWEKGGLDDGGPGSPNDRGLGTILNEINEVAQCSLLEGDVQEFYHITVAETDGSPEFQVSRIEFNSDSFYVTQNTRTDRAIVNFRGTAGAGGGGITGITFFETSGGPSYTDTDFAMDSGFFYLSASGGDGNPILSLHSSALDISDNSKEFSNISRLEVADNQFYFSVSSAGAPVLNLNTPDPEGLLQLGKSYDGSLIDPVTLSVTSDGSDITLNVTSAASPVRFICLGLVLEWTPTPFTITPAAADTAPEERYLWVDFSLNIVEGSNWPLTPHVRLARVIVQTAAGTQTNGPLKVHAYTDHISEGAGTAEKPRGFVGHIHSVGQKLRFDADWSSGVGLTVTENTTPTPDDIYVATTSGIVFQLHEHTFPARDSDPVGANDPLFVVNDPTTPYTTINSLSEITQDANGNAFSVTARFNVVLWGAINEAEVDSKLFINLPALTGSTAQYNGDSAAIADSNSTAVYTVPSGYRGVAFLIARITLKKSGGGNTWESINEQDLRGTSPQVLAGGATGGGEVNTASNLGAGEGVFASKVDLDLQFKSLVAGAGIELSSSATEITLNAPEKFYLVVAETDGDPSLTGIGKINFNSDDFYVTQNPGNTDEATVNFRDVPSTEDNFSYNVVRETITIPTDQQMAVFGGVDVLDTGTLVVDGQLVLEI